MSWGCFGSLEEVSNPERRVSEADRRGSTVEERLKLSLREHGGICLLAWGGGRGGCRKRDWGCEDAAV